MTDAQVRMEVAESDPVLEKLFECLGRLKNDQSKAISMALTIHARYKTNLPVLVRLFEFYKESNLIDMASDLLENDLLKANAGFNLTESDLFDSHLNRFSAQIIFNFNVKLLTEKASFCQREAQKTDRFYLDLFLKLAQQRQEKLVAYVLDKYRSNFNFIKSSPNGQELRQDSSSGSLLTLSEFHQRLGKHKDSLFYIKYLVLIYRKFINDYGVYLIDGFLNIEKQLFANTQLQDPLVASIEKRSLNILRRICVVDMIPEFIYLIDKLDNRHCYRWIEKSLEFYCKYALNSINVVAKKSEDGRSFESVSCRYDKLKLLHDCEFKLTSQDGSCLSETEVDTIKGQLKDFSEYEYVSEAVSSDDQAEPDNPFTCVFKILDEVGKKLDWLTVTPASISAVFPSSVQQSFSSSPLQAQTELKLSYLFKLKNKGNEKQQQQAANISNSLLSKQISFYGIALFFSKLVELQSIVRSLFADRFIMVRSFRMNLSNSFNNFVSEPVVLVNGSATAADRVLETIVGDLVYCVKLWHRFNQHKEYMTIVNKCLSNSKLDNLSVYKTFISDYYNTFSQALASNQTVTWEGLPALDLKAKVVAMVNLFINEKNSFQNFFQELAGVFEKLTIEESECSDKYHANMVIFENSFEAFELNHKNACTFFTKLLVEKFTKLVEQKPPNAFAVLNENDAYMGDLIVILQPNLNKCNFSDLYELIFHLIKQKGVFEYPEFFDYIYDELVLQDFALLASTDYKNFKKPGARFELRLSTRVEDFDPAQLSKRFLEQLNNDKMADRSKCLRDFFIRKSAALGELFEKTLKC